MNTMPNVLLQKLVATKEQKLVHIQALAKAQALGLTPENIPTFISLNRDVIDKDRALFAVCSELLLELIFETRHQKGA